ncbi:MAG: ETC complex I subunit [Geminicoccaceae bacterium]|nr:ETC complex I subunit [Geminicoccaceae bacterium]MCS7267943.1 ETC complex I subunit [Geminicoccaceae bacterium]MCX7630343.1 ETC complex I subunit [Geminicoccaceae bacterium]MDW8124427.1 NADH dehydrogenase ubiquinone Fe-S protein 4 [Geminicoccaceae bacterium]MDW8341780.1 NADH dehydrogenase ubiquinone Fe-S protein 4 [Geminicoccaceae bacterium]
MRRAPPRRARARPQLGPAPASTADRSLARPADGLPSPFAGARCRIRPLGRAPTSSAPRLNTRWLLELEPRAPQLPDRLVGWCGGSDPREQLRLIFPTCEAALAWAARYGLEVDLEPHRERRARPRPYAESLRAP